MLYLLPFTVSIICTTISYSLYIIISITSRVFLGDDGPKQFQFRYFPRRGYGSVNA
jgi:hypothetical protein